MRRFYSDELGEYMVRLNQVVKSFDNTIPTSSNHWSENPEVGFDYLKYYRKFVDYPGMKFYPGGNLKIGKVYRLHASILTIELVDMTILCGHWNSRQVHLAALPARIRS